METKVKSFIAPNISIKNHLISGDFLVSFKDPRFLWRENWFAVILEVVSALILFQVFRHAKKTNTQTAYLILAAALGTLFFEALPIFPREGYQLWWYHQGLVNFLKQRVPSFVISIFALVHCMADKLTSKSNLPNLTRSTITAVCGSLMMFPFLWFAPRLLLIVFHLDDPVLEHKLLGVPYIEILILFLLFFHVSHLFHQNYVSIESQERNTYSYVKCAIQTALVSAMYTIVEQYLLYIFLNLTINVNTGFCVVAAVLILMFLARKELQEMQMTSFSIQSIISPLMRKEFWAVGATMFFISTLPLWLNTYNLRSSSERLELGPCHIIQEVSNTSPLDIARRRYICSDDATQTNFDFHCLPPKELINGMNNRTNYYTICGKEISNPAEIFKYLSFYSLLCMGLFYSLMRFSFNFKVQEKAVSEVSKKIE